MIRFASVALFLAGLALLACAILGAAADVAHWVPVAEAGMLARRAAANTLRVPSTLIWVASHGSTSPSGACFAPAQW